MQSNLVSTRGAEVKSSMSLNVSILGAVDRLGGGWLIRAGGSQLCPLTTESVGEVRP